MSGLFSCFLRGTRILTSKGEEPVEKIAADDLVFTRSSGFRPIRWVGRRRLKKASNSKWPKDFMPVRVARHALDEKTPHADLYLSPSHALFLEGVLIPAIHLVNGKSIAQTAPESMAEIEYFHIELEDHQVIFAEGAPVETLLVTNGREHFDNFIEYERRYGADHRPAMTPYAPIASYNGGRSELNGLLRRLASPVADVRNPIQRAYDRLATPGTPAPAVAGDFAEIVEATKT